MWAVDMAVVVVLGLLAMAQISMQQVLRNPLHGIMERSTNNAEPSLGVIATSNSAEKALNASGEFILSSTNPYIDYAGRRFFIGTIRGATVVYVKSGSLAINVAMTTQLLLDFFISIRGIVHFGSAGTVDDSLPLGNVVVPSSIAYTGVLNWKSFGSVGGELTFGDYNYPEKGQNLLGTIKYESLTLSSADSTQRTLWLEANSRWLSIASQLKVSLTHGLPFIVFRGVSNSAGAADSGSTFSSLANSNAVAAAVEFIALVDLPHTASN
ncbi:bark storage protein B isoform X2 [Hevea brasiliensis]|uniref:bark storage protein B isoform X2 n=1 Tax=Hevea brasiliensis TaxID=3981 RepID=UPI0025D6F271|nr:bark storage protein B isoform X2 [Hevea brasiliensis]